MTHEIEFFEPEEMPRPAAEVQVESLTITPYPDRRRVHLKVRFTPFFERPSLDVVLLDPEGQLVAEMSIIEAYEREMEVTMHLRDPEPRESYLARASLYYGDRPVQHMVETQVKLPPVEQTDDERPASAGGEPAAGSDEAHQVDGREASNNGLAKS